MIEDSSSRLKRGARRLAAGVRPAHIAVVAAVAVVAVALAGVRAVALPGPRPVLDHDRLQIEVVAPTEPEIRPGAVMEVGELVEGFQGVPRLPPPVVERAHYETWDEAAEPSEPRPAPKRYVEDAVIQAPPQPEPPARDWRDGRVGRWFGFDAPERDYRAEREARRARMEARAERDREPREVRRYRSDGRPDDRDWRESDRWRDEPPPARWD